MVEAVQIPASGKIEAGQVFIQGRINGVRQYEGSYYSLVALPAADQYSMPKLIEVRSTQPLGMSGSDVRMVCEVGGFPNNYQTTDKHTGVTQLLKTARNTLDFVRAL